MTKTITPAEKKSRKSSKASRSKKGWAWGGQHETREQARARRYADKKNAKRRQAKLKHPRKPEPTATVAARVERNKAAARKLFENFLRTPQAERAAASRTAIDLAWWLNGAFRELLTTMPQP